MTNINPRKKGVRIREWWMRKPAVTGLLVFFFLFLIIAVITWQRYEIIQENEHQEMSSVLNVVKQNIEQTLRNSYTTALTLALTINDHDKPENFEAVAARLIDSNSNFQAVQLVPDGVIKYIYPMKGNEKALNANVFKITAEHSMRAYESIRSRKIYFTGPNRLKQGGIGIIGRLPVYKENKFWGFSAVVIKLNTFFRDVGIVNPANHKFYFQFSRYNIANKKEEFFLPEEADFSDRQFESVVIPDGKWKIYLVSKNKYGIILQIAYPLIFGLFMAILSSFLITKLLKKHLELQVVADDQASKLLETEIKFKTIFDEAAIGIGVIGAANGRFSQVNKKMCSILGYTEHELLEKKLGDILSAEDSASHIEGFHNNQKRYIPKNSAVKWANIVRTSLLDDQGLCSGNDIVILEDMTELNDSIKMVTEQNKRLLNFSYIVSHNLRSHTSNIQAITELIENCSSEAELSEMLNLLKKVSGSLDETMINLNKVVNIQMSIDVITESLDLRKCIEKTLNILDDQIKLKQAVILNHVTAGIYVNYNPVYLESILLNFIFNAIRYSHPERTPVIELRSDMENEQTVLEISDNGIGINLDRYSKELFGLYKTFTDNPESKGVGLFISKNQIDAMGGKVTVESIVGLGTTFSIYFKV
jgi:sensor domain CHASE-containing protein/signal transduction histidine kinase